MRGTRIANPTHSSLSLTSPKPQRYKAAKMMPARDPALTSRIMAAVRSRDTTPEIRFRRALRALGRRYRVCVKGLPGCPDLVFPVERVAVFVDGDFWHGRQWRLRGHVSLESQFARSHHRTYWVEKITRNVQRDRQTTRRLRKLGWRVVRVWESDVRSRLGRCHLRTGTTRQAWRRQSPRVLLATASRCRHRLVSTESVTPD